MTQKYRHPIQTLGFRSIADLGIPLALTSASLLRKMNRCEWHMMTPSMVGEGLEKSVKWKRSVIFPSPCVSILEII